MCGFLSSPKQPTPAAAPPAPEAVPESVAPVSSDYKDSRRMAKGVRKYNTAIADNVFNNFGDSAAGLNIPRNTIV